MNFNSNHTPKYLTFQEFLDYTLDELAKSSTPTSDPSVTTNSNGGKQSKLDVRLDLLPPVALIEVGKILDQGAKKYGVDNWKLIPTSDHLNHALAHIYLYLKGDRSEKHLVNAACRMLFAVDQDQAGK